MSCPGLELFALLFTTLPAIPLQAGFVSYGFLGQINSVDAPLDAVFSLGDELAIFHVMDAAIADTNPDPTKVLS